MLGCMNGVRPNQCVCVCLDPLFTVNSTASTIWLEERLRSDTSRTTEAFKNTINTHTHTMQSETNRHCHINATG